MFQKLFLILSLGLPVVLCSYGGHDLFTSLSQLHSLWRNEQAFVNKMEEALTNMEVMATAMKRYIKSYKETALDKEPNFEYLGHPLNSYLLVRHVAFAYQYIAEAFEPMTNSTKDFLDAVRERQNAEMLPATRDVQGAGFGIARLHSLYSINTDRMFDEGVISTHFNNKDVLSAPSVLKFNSWDMTLIGAQSSSNGLYNTMIDAYQKAINKLKEEEKTGTFVGDIFNQQKVNMTELNRLYRKAVKVHDHNLDKRGSRQGGARTHELPIDEKLRKKKKYHKKNKDKYVPVREAMPKNNFNTDKEEEYNFKSNLQKEMLCAGESFRDQSNKTFCKTNFFH